MPLREDLLKPIAGENPSGIYLRHDTKLLLYDKIDEARRQDDGLPQGDWQLERKVADSALVINLAEESLATKTKDLQLAAWLTEALLRKEGFSGLLQGIQLCRGLLTNFWDTIYPPVEDGDLELRGKPLNWLGSALEMPLKSVPLVRSGYDWYKFKESRVVGYEKLAQGDKERSLREQRLSEGKLAPEVFDKAFVETPKAFYLQAEKDLDGCIEALKSLDELCDEKFGSDAPSLGKLKTALGEVHHTVHALLEKKRETEPDPMQEAPTAGGQQSDAALSTVAASGAAGPSIVISVLTSSEPPDRREAIANVARAAAFLRKREPYSPAPYLMMRGLRWGELRAATRLSDATLLEAPPTELRQHLKRLALSKSWNELLETAENAMSLPCSRAWLDLQRLVVEGCNGLGGEYEPIAAAICSELKALVNDVPQLLEANLLDDTPAANSDTKAWLKSLAGDQAAQPSPQNAAGENTAPSPDGQIPTPSWPAKVDNYLLAMTSLKAGQPQKAFEIMQREIARQASGRGRFECTIQLVQLCVDAGKDSIAQPLLNDIAAAIEAHKLDDWEDKEMVAAALAMIMKFSQRVRDDAAERQKLFERICRLDPVRALSAG